MSNRKKVCGCCGKILLDNDFKVHENDIDPYYLTVFAHNGNLEEIPEIIKHEYSITEEFPKLFCGVDCFTQFFHDLAERILAAKK